MSLRRFTERVSRFASPWRASALVAASAVVSEIGARIGLPGVDGGRVAAMLRAVGSGPLRLYDLLAGRATSRAAILALGLLPYVQARLYLWLGQALLGRLRHRAMPSPSRPWVLGLTTGLALLQSVGFARFLESVAGAVEAPGVAFVIRTALLVTGASLALGWLTEELVNPTGEANPEAAERERAARLRADGPRGEPGSERQLTEGAASELQPARASRATGVGVAR